jgi:hypothetical protein
MSPDSAPARSKIYRLTLAGKARFLMFAAICLGAGALCILMPNEPGRLWAPILLATLFIPVGIYTALYAFLYRVTFNEDSVSVAGPLCTHSLNRYEIKGRRRMEGYRTRSYYRLEGSAHKSGWLPINGEANYDQEWRDWFFSLPNLANKPKPNNYRKSKRKHMGQ